MAREAPHTGRRGSGPGSRRSAGDQCSGQGLSSRKAWEEVEGTPGEPSLANLKGQPKRRLWALSQAERLGEGQRAQQFEPKLHEPGVLGPQLSTFQEPKGEITEPSWGGGARPGPAGRCLWSWDTRFGHQCEANLSTEQGLPFPATPTERPPWKWWAMGPQSPSLSLQGGYRSLGTLKGS